MKEAHKTKSRRQFIEDGLRTIMLGGLAFVGLSLGWRGISHSGEESSCAVDLPCRICSKLPGKPLTSKEWEKIKLHPALGYGLIKEIKMVDEVGNIILYHHERYDGKGYPKGLKKD